MATVKNVKLSIAASRTNSLSSIISYSYELYPDDADLAAQRDFSVSVGLWGEDLIDDDVLETDLDEHTVAVANASPGEPISVARRFEVETELLDEDLVGDDEVFIIVEARAGETRTSGKSNTVVGNF
jgi:hypothetical protein